MSCLLHHTRGQLLVFLMEMIICLFNSFQLFLICLHLCVQRLHLFDTTCTCDIQMISNQSNVLFRISLFSCRHIYMARRALNTLRLKKKISTFLFGRTIKHFAGLPLFLKRFWNVCSHRSSAQVCPLLSYSSLGPFRVLV